MPFTIQEFFKWGLDREIPSLAQPPRLPLLHPLRSQGPFWPTLEIAPGKKKKIPTTHKLGLPEWDATKYERLPFADESLGEVHAYQFMEHLSWPEAHWLLREIERVLVPGGVLNMVTPYPGHGHFYQALDHKTAWTEETWNWLFGNQYYDDHEGEGWKLKVHCCFMMGIVYRNLDLFTQLVKEN